MLFDKVKAMGHAKDSPHKGEGASHQDVEDAPAAATSGPTGINRIQEIGKYALDPNTNNNLIGLRAQILG